MTATKPDPGRVPFYGGLSVAHPYLGVFAFVLLFIFTDAARQIGPQAVLPTLKCFPLLGLACGTGAFLRREQFPLLGLLGLAINLALLALLFL